MNLALRGSGSFCHIGKLAEFGPRTRLPLKIIMKMAPWVTSRQMPETIKKATRTRKMLRFRVRAILALRNYASCLKSIYPGLICNSRNNCNGSVKTSLSSFSACSCHCHQTWLQQILSVGKRNYCQDVKPFSFVFPT